MSHRMLMPALAAFGSLMMPMDVLLADVTVVGEGDTTTVTRTLGDHSEDIEYVVERVGASIKFEDAPVGLGEDDALDADTFVIRVEEGGDTVKVETKAARNEAEWISGESDSNVDANGFQIDLLSIEKQSDGSTLYTIKLSSTEAVRYALSHVTFTFYPGEMSFAAYD